MALTVRFPGVTMAPMSNPTADFHMGLENNGANVKMTDRNSFDSKFIRTNQTTLS